MRPNKWICGVAIVAAAVFGISSVPAWAEGGPALPWKSPATVTSGVPFHVASIARCPAVPTPGDSVLVEIFLSFGPGGGSGDVLVANPDGSWSGTFTFFFSGVNIRQTTITATCLDFDGSSVQPYANYMSRHTQIFG